MMTLIYKCIDSLSINRDMRDQKQANYQFYHKQLLYIHRKLDYACIPHICHQSQTGFWLLELLDYFSIYFLDLQSEYFQERHWMLEHKAELHLQDLIHNRWVQLRILQRKQQISWIMPEQNHLIFPYVVFQTQQQFH